MKKLIVIIAFLALMSCAAKQPMTVEQQAKQDQQTEKIKETTVDLMDIGVIVYDIVNILN